MQALSKNSSVRFNLKEKKSWWPTCIHLENGQLVCILWTADCNINWIRKPSHIFWFTGTWDNVFICFCLCLSVNVMFKRGNIQVCRSQVEETKLLQAKTKCTMRPVEQSLGCQADILLQAHNCILWVMCFYFPIPLRTPRCEGEFIKISCQGK